MKTNSGELKQKLGLLDLTLLGVGSMIGSGWLFAAAKTAGYAGSNAGWAWVIGALIILVIALVFAEIASALPRAGGFVRYPNFTHGNVVGFVIGLSALLAYTSTAGVEAEAVREYAVYWWPALGNAAGNPTALGFALQIGLLVVFFLINYWSVKTFGRVNTVVTTFKFVVPLLVLVTLYAYFNGSNLHEAPPTTGLHGIFSSLTGAGIAFSYLGFRQAVDFASEARNPQRDIPLAIIIALAIAFVVYLLLQYAYIGSVPNDVLTQHGWDGIAALYHSPFADVAVHLGVTWLVTLILVDAVISPAGTGNVFLAGASRVLFAWARNGHLFEIFGKIDEKSGVPRGALWLSLILSILWMLPSNFQAWGGLISACTSAMVFTYLPGPVCLAVFRKKAPDMHLPFRLPAYQVIAPITFICSSLLVYWSGWAANEVLLGILIVAWIIYSIFGRSKVKGGGDVFSGVWMLVYYIGMYFISYFGSFDGTGALSSPWDIILTAVLSLICYYWGIASSLKTLRIEGE